MGLAMKKAPPPHNEADRLAALGRYGILDTPPDAVLDGNAQAAADLCETPIALRSIGKQAMVLSCRLSPLEVK